MIECRSWRRLGVLSQLGLPGRNLRLIERRRRVQRLEPVEVEIDQMKTAVPGSHGDGARGGAHLLTGTAAVIADIGFQTPLPGRFVEREFNETCPRVESDLNAAVFPQNFNEKPTPARRDFGRSSSRPVTGF